MSNTGLCWGIHFNALKHKLWELVRTALSVPSKNKKKYRSFSTENCHFYCFKITSTGRESGVSSHDVANLSNSWHDNDTCDNNVIYFPLNVSRCAGIYC